MKKTNEVKRYRKNLREKQLYRLAQRRAAQARNNNGLSRMAGLGVKK